MVACLNWYFEVHGYYQEALSAFKGAVDSLRDYGAPGALQTAAEISTFAFLLDSLGWFEFRTGNVQLAVPLLAESLELARGTGDPEVLYYVYGNWGYLSLLTGDIADARPADPGKPALRADAVSVAYGHSEQRSWHRGLRAGELNRSPAAAHGQPEDLEKRRRSARHGLLHAVSRA